jgi:hypothetical protein
VQGRILLPAALRKAVDLAGETVVVGVIDRFELWAPERWDDFLRESERLLDDVSLGVQWPAPGGLGAQPRGGVSPQGSSAGIHSRRSPPKGRPSTGKP